MTRSTLEVSPELRDRLEALRNAAQATLRTP